MVVAIPIALFIAIMFVYLMVNEYKNRISKYPPGPRPLPFFGNLLQIDTSYPHRTMIKWKRQYGPIFTVWLPKPAIVLADYAVMREALIAQGNLFAGRPMTYVFGIFSGHRPDGDGIILSQNDTWTSQRRLALRIFRDFGMGKNLMESKITNHTQSLIEYIKKILTKTEDDCVNLHVPIAFCVGNIIQDMVIGKNYDFGDAEFLRFKKIIDSTLKDFMSVELLLIDSFPWLRFLSPTFRRFCKNGFALQNFFLQQIDEHEKRIDFTNNDEPTDFIDAYIREIYQQIGQDQFSKVTLALNSGDLWTGGMETTVTTIRWAIIYLIHFPDVQQRLHREIDEELGDRKVQWSDRNQMTYTMAVLAEVQRIINILPWHIPHATTGDTVLRNYKISKGTVIMPQLGAIHLDELIFPNAEYFDPSRFIDDNNCLRNLQQFNPFGIGKRSCLGESLARMELFIIFATLLQNFHFTTANGVYPSLQRSSGMASVPKEYQCGIRVRSR